MLYLINAQTIKNATKKLSFQFLLGQNSGRKIVNRQKKIITSNTFLAIQRIEKY